MGVAGGAGGLQVGAGTHVRRGPEGQERQACCVWSEREAVCRVGQPVALWRGSEDALAGPATHARLQEME